MMRLRVEWVIIAIALAGLIAFAFAAPPPPRQAVDTFATDDFRSGGYAAWQALLAREGIPAQRFEQRPSELDAALDTLIVAYAPAGPLTVPRTLAEDVALADWVRAGGRAVILGIATPLARLERERLGRPVSDEPGGGGTLRGPWAADVRALADLGPRRFTRTPRTTPLLGDGGGAIVVRVAVGKGEAIYVTEPRLFANATIARADNARLAFLLARPRRAGGTVAFDEALHGAVVDRSWWSVLPIPDRVGLAGGALAVALAMIGGALRLGPPVRLQPPREPTSVEYVDALAALYARVHARGHALAALAAALPAAIRNGAAAQPLVHAAGAEHLDDALFVASAQLARRLREEHADDRNRDRGRATDSRRTRTRRRRQ
jgi:hypothetical protein